VSPARATDELLYKSFTATSPKSVQRARIVVDIPFAAL
jgi:hypothetical protein